MRKLVLAATLALCGVPLLSMSASAQRYGGPEYGDTRGGPEYRERDYRSREGGYGNRSAAKPSTLTHTKSLIVGGARRHLPAHDRLANVGITAQVLAFIEPILTTPGPSAPFSVPVLALSVAVAALRAALSAPVIAPVLRATTCVAVLRATISLGRGRH